MAQHIARKRFGQHFLTDVHIIESICDAIAPQSGEALVEIGPGLGAMTLPLLNRIPAFSVIELDRDLAGRLRQRPGLEVIESDVLKVDFAALAAAKGQKLRVVGNLPYNISTPILFHLLGAVDHVVDQHFMLQKEVVDRMAASPCCKDYGRLTVMLQWRYAIESVFDVPPEAFDPPPRVMSAIVRMQPYAQPPAVDSALMGEMVAAAFSQRRKLLRHSLGVWLTARGFSGHFDLQRRAEEVPVQEFVDLALAVSAASPKG
ncbi:16S rRNA (adenine(1518)-N(6)/adenine(1519)-N(6))-dimethyltransferase RsmA [Paucibacter sp. DJ1R-11]|uniref:16S rRNA (adenine(1518)-N(6)/adenine(1519)-N(6))- dimethyltransferase RsmA n=1 Tax=Paucibacter sp. DJ1R-11 TaxID=2893556 RepID=UPI0021E4D200|nr:16S rRNA (adenine(1518)-N(6)/adenine(1519)-N(6))-dimethyltransferase RsmA [Paucibacter sp. DJ1R-11]MCV2362234.1 16S rRNA (adenine(1518)-N(6)/adenine(1519)-N(6))-dimethyltransferase RsmA [Paucibacter sp. DJ1R-11]